MNEFAFRPFTVFLAIAFAASAGLLIYLEINGSLKSPQNDAQSFALAELSACGRARQLLGEPIEKTSGKSIWDPDIAVNGRHSTRFIVKVKGTKAMGQYESDAARQNGAWRLTLGQLDAGGQRVDVVACLAAQVRNTK